MAAGWRLGCRIVQPQGKAFGTINEAPHTVPFGVTDGIADHSIELFMGQALHFEEFGGEKIIDPV